MNWDTARKTIYSALKSGWSAHPTIEIFYAGRPLPDLTLRTSPFLTIKINPRRVRQVGTAGPTRTQRCFGAVEVYIFAPDTLGDKTFFDPLETLEGLFTATTITGIVFGEAAMIKPAPAVGWASQGFVGSFYFEKV